MSDLKKLKIVELKKELSSRNLNIKGNKAELLQRLEEFIEAAGEDNIQTTTDATVPAVDVGVEEDDIDDTVAEGGDEILEPDEEEEVAKEESLGSKVTLDLEVPNDEEVKQPELKERNQITIVAPKVIKTALDVTDVERKKIRSEKFQTPLSDDAKKAARAKRFGGTLAVDSSIKSSFSLSISSNPDLLKKRAERFGTNVSPVAVKAEEKEKMLKRKQRFGGILTLASNEDLETKKKKRAERFSID